MHSIHSIHSIHRPETCPGFVCGSQARPCLHRELLLAAFQTHQAGRRVSCIFQSWHHFFSLLRASKSYHSQAFPCHCILRCLFDFLKHHTIILDLPDYHGYHLSIFSPIFSDLHVIDSGEALRNGFPTTHSSSASASPPLRCRSKFRKSLGFCVTGTCNQHLVPHWNA